MLAAALLRRPFPLQSICVSVHACEGFAGILGRDRREEGRGGQSFPGKLPLIN